MVSRNSATSAVSAVAQMAWEPWRGVTNTLALPGVQATRSAPWEEKGSEAERYKVSVFVWKL